MTGTEAMKSYILTSGVKKRLQKLEKHLSANTADKASTLERRCWLALLMARLSIGMKSAGRIAGYEAHEQRQRNVR